MARTASKSLFTADLIVPAIGDAFRKLDPRQPVSYTHLTLPTICSV